MTDIFDELVATKPATEAETATPTAESTEANASAWPQTLTLPAGERPEGSDTVAEFAERVNKQLVNDRVQELLNDGKTPFEAATEALSATVNQASFYQAVKAQRNPMPHYEVKYEVEVTDAEGNPTGEVKTETKVYVPVDVALEWWKNRPTRGGGGAARSDEDIEKRLVRAGKKKADLDSARERLAKLTSNVARMEEQLTKYTEWLAEDGKTIEDAVAAYEASVEKEEAEKAISDTE